MKKKSLLLLLAHYHNELTDQLSALQSYESLQDLFPDLSAGGTRALCWRLIDKKLLQRVVIQGNSYFQLTYTGRQFLSLSYPALSTDASKKTKKPYLVVFLSGNTGQKSFTQLSRLYKKESVVKISRGVYFFPLGISPELQKVHLTEYSSCLLSLQIEEFSQGLEAILENSMPEHHRLQVKTKEISNKIEYLLKNLSDKKAGYAKEKQFIRLAFEHFVTVLTDFTELQAMDKKSVQAIRLTLSMWQRLVGRVYFHELQSVV